MIKRLDVILWDKKVGTLVSEKKGYGNSIFFYFDDSFIKYGLDIAPVRASIHGVVARRQLPVYPESDRIFGGLPSFISDSLPDHWGHLVFKEWVKRNGIHTKDLSSLDLLAYIGRRGMGALEFLPPASDKLETRFKVEIEKLSQLARKVVEDAGNFHITIEEDFPIESLFKVGTSAGGRRPKAVINYNPDTGECYSGQVSIEDKDFIPMIIKFDEHSDFPSTLIEYSYYLMAKEVGLEMMPSRLLKTGDGIHFLTNRFDRKNGGKIHVQTLAAMNPLADSYEDLFDVAIRIGISREEIEQIYVQMVMNVVTGNIDDHSKNFSFMMGEDGDWRKAPVYDYTFAVDSDTMPYMNMHGMSINGRRGGIREKDLLEIASRYGVKRGKGVIGKCVAKAQEYAKFAREAGVEEKWIGIIEREISEKIEGLRG